MVVIRCTQKLLRRAVPSRPVTASSDTRLGDWSGTLFGVGTQRFVLFASEHSRLPVLMPARGLKDIGVQLCLRLGPVSSGLRVPAALADDELAAMQDVLVAPTNSRSVLGSLNDFVHAARHRLQVEPSTDLLTMALWLGETPVGPINYESPNDVTRQLFGLPRLPRRAV